MCVTKTTPTARVSGIAAPHGRKHLAPNTPRRPLWSPHLLPEYRLGIRECWSPYLYVVSTEAPARARSLEHDSPTAGGYPIGGDGGAIVVAAMDPLVKTSNERIEPVKGY